MADERPAAPTNQVVRVGDLAFVSGQVGIEDGQIARGDFARQFAAAVTNVERQLALVGVGLDAVVKLTTYLVDRDHGMEFLELRRKVWPEVPPATTTVVVEALLLPDLLVELDVIARLPSA